MQYVHKMELKNQVCIWRDCYGLQSDESYSPGLLRLGANQLGLLIEENKAVLTIRWISSASSGLGNCRHKKHAMHIAKAPHRFRWVRLYSEPAKANHENT